MNSIKLPMQRDVKLIRQLNESFIESAEQKDGWLLREEAGKAGGKFSATVMFINCKAVITFRKLTTTLSCGEDSL